MTYTIQCSDCKNTIEALEYIRPNAYVLCEMCMHELAKDEKYVSFHGDEIKARAEQNVTRS